MAKMLLQNFTGNSEANENAVVVTQDENKSLSDLMQELKPHLDNASKDLLQPRPEAIAQVLKKALR